MSSQKTWVSKASLWAAIVGFITSLIAGFVSFYANQSIELGDFKVELREPIERSSTSFIEVENKLIALGAKVESLTEIPDDLALTAKTY